MDTIEQKFEDALEKVKNFDKIDIAKAVATMAVHHCVAAVVVTIAHNLMPTTTKKEKIQLYVAARAVSGMVADKATDRMRTKMDKAHEFVKELVNDNPTPETSKDEPEKPIKENLTT